MVMDWLPSEVSATFLVIFGSSLKCAGLGETDVEPPGLSSSPENATASASPKQAHFKEDPKMTKKVALTHDGSRCITIGAHLTDK